ncbi:hypothetical protein [Psychroflexus planctonicus]|uniref:Viral A-type inclusion protein n=1 Tax=Psychroflexus planctonicus TaxID=1526575 RepID=A0ABQ1SJT0_9FLAO|nr:hypothetical protein [Psychroflexus planctonicus]GGE38113.1 hypothetical protein GCM10010832_17950 [Psychroflexus planctonicus]
MKKIALSLSLILLVSLSFTSCQDENKKDEPEVEELQKKFNEKMKETIAIHDEVMPKMTKINLLLTNLEKESAKLPEDEYNEAMGLLQESHEEMMSWMKKFSNYFDSKEVNSGISIEDIDELKAKNEMLNSFKESAEEMQKNMNRNIENAQELFDRFQ